MELRPLSRLLLVLTLAAVSLPAAASAKSINKRAIRQQFEHKVFLLRGRYACPPPHKDNNTGPSIVVEGGGKFINAPVATPQGPLTCTLRFNEEGQLQNTALVVPFSLSAIYVDTAKVNRHALILQTYPVTLLRLSRATPPKLSALRLDHLHLQIQIAIDRSQPAELQSALQTIFAGNIHQFLKSESPGKRKADLASLPLLAPETEAQARHELVQVGWPAKHVFEHPHRAGLIAPKSTYFVLPRYTNRAKTKHVQGVCSLYAVVNANGFPQDIRVLKTLPDGLDERAIVAVSQYRFRPAKTVNGKPVPVAMIIDIHFHLF